MLPVFFSIGGINVSSFGVFLALGFFWAVFLIWRLCRAWDLDEEKTLDLILLTFVGGLIGARIYFAVENWQYFAAMPLNLFIINKVPGFNFWGGFLGGWLTLYFFSRRFKADFWQLTDIAVVGLIGSLIMTNIGCFLGGCDIGAVTKFPISFTMVGMLGKRWPVQLLEALLLILVLRRIWFQATHFHYRGTIVSLGFIYLGFTQLAIEPLKQDHSGIFLSAMLTLLGACIFYITTKQSPLTHLRQLNRFFVKFFSDPKSRTTVVQNIGKYWYNQKTGLGWRIKNFKKLLRRSNVKLS